LETGLDACGHRLYSECLGETGDAFQQEVTVGQQSQQETIHQILLPDHNVTNLLPERWNPLAQLSYFLRNFLSRFHTVSLRHVRHAECSIKPCALKANRISILCQIHAKGRWQCQLSNRGIERFL